VSRGNHKPVLAVDLGGTKIAAAVVSPQGKVISQTYCLSLAHEGPKAVINRLFSGAHQALQQSKLQTSELKGLAIAAAGALDTKRGLVTASPHLPGWCDVPLRDIVAEKLGVETYLINDASAAALGEYHLGAGKGVDNLIYLTVSTGIGGGIIVNGELYQGVDGSAGEIGHMTIDVNGEKCSCGNIGCWETLASGTAVAKETVRRLSQGERSSLLTLTEGKMENITAQTVAQAARQGDTLACDVIAKAAYYLGIGLVNLVNIFNPERIVIGGGMAQMGSLLFAPAQKVVKERAFFLPARTVRIIRAKLGGNSAIIGAALFVFQGGG